jgi:uncharacterized membrane protein YfcA
MELTASGVFIVCCTAILCGISRTAIPGLGILLVPLVAMAMPARASTGFLLPILIEADLMAVFYLRRKVALPHLVRILPWTALGIVLGFFLMRFLSDSIFKPFLGTVIVGFVALDLVRRWAGIEIKAGNKVFACAVGVSAGAFTMIANAGGPVMAIYLLSMSLPKEEFIGTSALFFCLINLFKVPFSVALGLITWTTLGVDLMLIPLIAIGCVAGVLFMKKLPQKAFDVIAQVLAALGGLKLFF